MFSAYLRSKYYCSSEKLVLLASSLPTNTPQELFSLRRILSNTFTAPSHSTLPVSSKSTTSSNRKKKDANRSFTVYNYLVDSCGLSPEDAARASQRVHFASPDKPDSVLSLLRNHGFTQTQVTILVRQYPHLLVADTEKTLLPKFQFYQSIGFSDSDLAKTVTYAPNFLRSSLENHIIPTYTFLKSVLHSDEKVCLALRNFQKHSTGKPCTVSLVPNIALLRKLQVPETSIVYLLTHFPEAVDRSPEEFGETVSTVTKMGFSPSKSVFVFAVRALSGRSSRSIWDRSYEIYNTKWGWSEDDILLAFKKQPFCMLLSEKKITGIMEFLVNTMGRPPREVATCPGVFTCSLQKRIVPRCSVVRLLPAKGLLKKNYTVGTILIPGEKYFINTFVTKYEAQVPELMSFYQGKKMDALNSG